jgi:hypothetical protein
MWRPLCSARCLLLLLSSASLELTLCPHSSPRRGAGGTVSGLQQGVTWYFHSRMQDHPLATIGSGRLGRADDPAACLPPGEQVLARRPPQLNWSVTACQAPRSSAALPCCAAEDLDAGFCDLWQVLHSRTRPHHRACVPASQSHSIASPIRETATLDGLMALPASALARMLRRRTHATR